MAVQRNDHMSEVEQKEFRGSPVLAYLAAVTASAASFALIFTTFMVIRDGFEQSTNNPLGVKIAHLALSTFAAFCAGWLFALVTAILPFVLGLRLLKRLQTGTAKTFLLGGLITGIILSPLFALIPIFGINVQGSEASILAKTGAILPFFAISGIVAGITCWKVLTNRYQLILGVK